MKPELESIKQNYIQIYFTLCITLYFLYCYFLMKLLLQLIYNYLTLIPLLFLGETLTLYMNMEDSVERLWMDTSDRAWTKVTVALDLSDLNGSFSLLFHAQYIEGCVNSVGIDDIIFNPCPEGKLYLFIYWPSILTFNYICLLIQLQQKLSHLCIQ